MRWTRGLQTEVLEHMPPCSAPRWLLIACTLVFAQLMYNNVLSSILRVLYISKLPIGPYH